MNFLNTWIFWFFIIFLVVIFLWWGYSQNDCIHGKDCIASVEIDFDAPPDIIKNKIQEMMDKAQPNILPFAIAASLAVTVPSVYFLVGGTGTLGQLLAVFIFSFIAIWFVSGWIQFHFYNPNFDRIMEGINSLYSIRQNNIRKDSIKQNSIRKDERRTKKDNDDSIFYNS